MNTRIVKDLIFKFICYSTVLLTVIILFKLVFHILSQGLQWFDWQFITSLPSRKVEKAGIYTALIGTLWIISLTALIAIPIGVATALYLEEYCQKSKWKSILQVNIANLAAMPSIIYGLLGLAIFVRFWALERSVIAAALTLSLLILPIIILSSQNAIRAVPNSIREAAYALGAFPWQVSILQVLPAAISGIMTGLILAISRAIGETAPLLIVGALSYVAFTPESLMDEFTVLPVQIYSWAARPQEEFHYLAAAGIIALLIVLLVMNSTAIYIRQKFQRYKI